MYDPPCTIYSKDAQYMKVWTRCHTFINQQYAHVHSQDWPGQIHPSLHHSWSGDLPSVQSWYGALMAKFDVDADYRNMPLLPSHRIVLGMK